MLSISQAAQILGVNKKTLMRWDAAGKFPAIKDSKTGARSYEEKDIQDHAQWFNIRRKHKAHNRLLTAIRKEVDRFSATIPLNAGAISGLHNVKDMQKAYSSLRTWEKKHKEILKEYSKLPTGFYHKVDPEL